MKKILLASDGRNLPKGAFEFIKELQQSEPVLVTGSFLHALNFEKFLPGLFALSSGPETGFLEEEKSDFNEAVSHFKKLCEHNDIEYRIHEESNTWDINDLAKETRFADLLLMSEELFYPGIFPTASNRFLQQAIHKSECPVMLFPESFRFFNQIIITYDGKKDSMFAIRQFCNLFPGYKNLETKIVFGKNDREDRMPDMVYLEEYAARHFQNLDLEMLYFDTEKHFYSWANERSDALIVSGAYGRSSLSTSFKKSFVEDVINQHNNALFIAHY